MRLSHNKHIGLVLSSLPGYSETFFKNKINGLVESGFRVSVFADYHELNYKPANFDVFYNLNLNQNKFKTVLEVSKAIIRSVFMHPKISITLFKLDRKDGRTVFDSFKNLVLSEFLLNTKLDWLHFGFGMLAYGRENVASAIGSQMAVSFRGYDLYLSPLKHPNCYNLLFTKKVKYHVLSHEMKNDLEKEGIKSHSIIVITPAIDTSFFKKENTDLNFNSNPLQFVTIARLHWKKGLVDTFEALKILKEKGLQFEYKLIGSGIEKDKLVYAAYQLGISENVKFLGRCKRNEIKAHLEKSDIYLQYSIQEGFCNAVLEAQAMGLLCVVSNAEGLAENVLHEKTGWVVPKRQSKLLADCIINVLEIPTEKKLAIKKRAVQRVKSQFNLSQQQQAFVDFYEECC